MTYCGYLEGQCQSECLYAPEQILAVEVKDPSAAKSSVTPCWPSVVQGSSSSQSAGCFSVHDALWQPPFVCPVRTKFVKTSAILEATTILGSLKGVEL